ncbi:MAG TPA: MFS transporter [Spirochaetota bacterium]|nr:MFS transporter [Spirochaetota bacterium]
MMEKTPGKSRGIIFYISMIGFLAIFTSTISKNPVLPYLVKSLGAGDQVLGLISSISPIAGIVFSFPVGFLADKIGKKKMLIIASLIFLSAPLLYLLVTNAFWLIPVRFFHGMATAILGPLASTIIAESYDSNRGEKLGVYSSATLIGRTLAPLTGGVIISYFAFYGELTSYRAVYVAAFLMSIPVVIGSFMVKTGETSVKKSVSVKEFFISIKYIAGNKLILATALVDLSTYFSFGIFETFTPGYLKNSGYRPEIVGLIFSLQILSIALTKPLFGRVADRIDKRIQIASGLFILGLSVAIIPFVTLFIPVLAVSMLFGLAMSFSTVATSAFVADVAEKEQLGASMGALSSIMDVGHSSGPLVAGTVITLISVKAGFLSGFILALLVSAVFVIFAWGTKK